jgi:succinyl-diaminopimelate desuccinylase
MQKQLESLLSSLIAFATSSNNSSAHHEALDWITEKLQASNLHITRYDGPYPSLVATSQPTRQPRVMLVAQLDVVPPNDSLQYRMQRENGRLLGRGVFDMKFALACYLRLTDKLAQYPDLDYGIMITTDEEVGSDQGVRMLLDEGWRAQVVVLPDGGDDWNIERRAKGVYMAQFSAQGVSAHASRPWEGTNAINKLLDAITAIRSSYPAEDKEDTTATITLFNGGTAVNQIPDEAKAGVDIRTFDNDGLASAREFIKTLCADNGLALTEISYREPQLLQAEHPLVTSFHSALERVREQPVAYCDSYGATDANWFARHNMPCIIMRPRGGGAHGPDEWIEAEDLATYYKVLRMYVLENA